MTDIYRDERIPRDAYWPTFVKSLVMTPVGPVTPAASIGVYWGHQYQASEYESKLLQSLASAADLALVGVRAYDEARSARLQAEAASRLKDEFLATISHELRTPLNGILGWARLLRVGRLSAEEMRRALETIERNAQAQNRLIEDLLDISRIISGKMRLDMREVKLVPVIEAALNVVRPVAEAKGVHLQSLLDAGMEAVAGDADRLQQVIWNLLSNAIKFTPRGGEVRVQLKLTKTQAEISVSDTGAGISPEFLPYVFDRFRQADGSSTRLHGGLGLGLAIVRHLVELHGGTVQAHSAGLGQGATFTLTFPLIASYQPDVLPLVSHTLPTDLKISLDGVHVLLVDDDPSTRDLLFTLLVSKGATVSAVASAAAGLAALTSLPDIIISDIEMPEEDGYAFIRKVRSAEQGRAAQVPAIALTAYARVEDRVRAISAGYQMHVPKPVEPTELLLVIASLAQRQEIL
jgi:signal transduction histidine kinase/ActR/RegA family two-component response regulator